MKIWFTACFIALISLSACNSDTDKQAVNVGNNNTQPLTLVEWESTTKDFNKITEGQKLTISYRFKNTGKNPLIIQSVRPGCGCTVADYPKEPISPGAEGVITGTFDSNGRLGMNKKEIYVTANTEGSANHSLNFSVEVIKARS